MMEDEEKNIVEKFLTIVENLGRRQMHFQIIGVGAV